MSNLNPAGNSAIDTSNGVANWSELAQDTGAVGYAQETETPTRFAPFPDEIATRLRNQYALTFTPATGHGLTGLKVESR